MKILPKKLLLLVFAFTCYYSYAQTNNRDFSVVDAYVKSLGPLNDMSMGTINNVVSNKFTDKIDKARAIYNWVANHITYDVKAARTNNISKNSPAEVLLSRKAVGIGFASLFQDMCSSADIRCLTVDGFIKNKTEEIGDKSIDINHSWAVVQLGESPEDWYYVDPAFGSGYFDEDMKQFTKAYSDAYFFTDKETFNLQHYPDNTAWKLGSGPKSKKDFFELPIIKVAAMEYGIKKITPAEGHLNVKENKAVKFSFTFSKMGEINKVELASGEKKKYKLEEIEYAFSGNSLSFTYKFENANSFPVTIFVNGKELVQYYVEVD